MVLITLGTTNRSSLQICTIAIAFSDPRLLVLFNSTLQRVSVASFQIHFSRRNVWHALACEPRKSFISGRLPLCLHGVRYKPEFMSWLYVTESYGSGRCDFALIHVFLFVRMFAGYFSARLYKTLNGQKWKRAALVTGTLYPGVIASLVFILNFFIWGKHSSGAVSVIN